MRSNGEEEMDTAIPDALLMGLIRLKDEVNTVSGRLSEGECVVFGAHSLPTPRFSSPELGFLLTVSWLYVLYFEAGKASLDFLKERFQVYTLDPAGHVADHIHIVGRIRTYLHHNLYPEVQRDRHTLEISEKWLEKHCRTRIPTNDEQWYKCLIALLQESKMSLETLRDCIREIEKDESREQIILTWNARLKQYHLPEEFDALIFQVVNDLGRESLDVRALRRRYYDKWVRELHKLSSGYDFSIEARKLIESTLLYELTPALPLTSRDIILELRIKTGKIADELLQLAKTLYDREPCSRERLLKRLKQESKEIFNPVPCRETETES